VRFSVCPTARSVDQRRRVTTDIGAHRVKTLNNEACISRRLGDPRARQRFGSVASQNSSCAHSRELRTSELATPPPPPAPNRVRLVNSARARWLYSVPRAFCATTGGSGSFNRGREVEQSNDIEMVGRIESEDRDRPAEGIKLPAISAAPREHWCMFTRVIGGRVVIRRV
jgi:hypothetical protein